MTNNTTTCPRCAQAHALITDRPGMDKILAQYYHDQGFGLIEVCMCADPRQLSVFWGNAFQRIKTRGKKKNYLACPDCAFWQIIE